MTRRIILVDIGAGLTLAGVLPSVALFADYSAQLKARGGQAPYTYTVTTGAAELTAAGLQLDPATGIISGTASVPGTIAITVRATDLSGAYVERGFIVAVIAEPLSLSGAAPLWTVGTPYSYTYTAAHGVPPYTWSIASGSLPAGLTLSATGEISGTPTAGNAPAWTVRVTDSAGTIIDLRDNITLQLIGDFADATVGTPYSSDLLVNGGNAPYSNPRVTVGTLPAGLTLSVVGDKLRLSGTPTAAATNSFTASVDSADMQMATSAQNVPVIVASDPHYSDVVSLLHFDGPGLTDCIDEKGNVWTPFDGWTTQSANALFGRSGYFDGSGDYVSTPHKTDFSAANSLDMTIECSIRPGIVSQYKYLATKRVSGGGGSREWALAILPNGTLQIIGFSSGGDTVLDLRSTTLIALNTWQHVAAVRRSMVWILFIGGHMEASATATASIGASSGPLVLGRDPSTPLARDYFGYMDEFRLTRFARYTSDFAPPTAPFANA